MDVSAGSRALLEELRGGVDVRRGFEVLDSLPPVEPDGMTGSWWGEEVPTGNPLDGFLGRYGWHGKRFGSPRTPTPWSSGAEGAGW